MLAGRNGKRGNTTCSWDGRVSFPSMDVTYTKGRRAAVEEALVGILVGFIMCLG